MKNAYLAERQAEIDNAVNDGFLLGTFDSILEAIEEITSIINCKQEYYCVKGFSDWDILEHLMLED